MENILVTGAAGFIGSNFVNQIVKEASSRNIRFVLLDSITYTADYSRIEATVENSENVSFEKINICDKSKLKQLFDEEKFTGVINFAAESHNDRAIENPNIFYETNVIGTLNLLNFSLDLFSNNPGFKFLQISTDEVYGDLSEEEMSFTELSRLKPTSPYSSSKASADLLCLSFFKTYNLPVLITRCSNNYGINQHDEKFIPQMVKLARDNKKLTLYGNGKNIRDWISVDDHIDGVWKVYNKGRAGEVYNMGGDCEKRNLDIAKDILKQFSLPENYIEYVPDRPGHDWRYSMDYSKIKAELGWEPKKAITDFLSSLKPTK